MAFRKRRAWKPRKIDIEWVGELIRLMSNGTWIVPASGAIYQFDHDTKTLTLSHRGNQSAENHSRNVVCFAAHGWKVVPDTLPE